MSEWLEMGRISDLKDGVMKAVAAAGREFLLVRIGGQYYVADKRCPHMGGDLSRGQLQGTVVTCPRHGSQFDLQDGHVVRWTTWTGLIDVVNRLVRSPRPIRTYPVRLDGDKVLAGI
ncbi:MAG: Rieske 2Fe-2S domain-containing protein [Dehalococcoidales bacterium]|nr:Rieske 2Fe-2S domain-containing protein [Dehalococcoidales bacterium]